MGSLLDSDSRLIVLFAGHLFGRAIHCRTRLNSAYASSEHARIQWNGRSWCLRDLGSRNGTFLNGTRIEPTVSVQLERGCSLSFGTPSPPWKMVDDSPPTAMAIAQGGGVVVAEVDGVIVLPTGKDEITVRRSVGHWLLERHGAIETISDGAHVEGNGTSYELVLPQIAPETAPLDDAGTHARLFITASADEEHVEVRLSIGARRYALGTREHNYLLLYLARRRFADETHNLTPEAVGWVYPEEVCSDLHLDRSRLNVDVYRIRKQFSMLDGIEIIERRSGTRQLRIGLADISLTAI